MKRAVAVSVVAVMVLGVAVAGTGQAKSRRVKVERRDSTGYVGAAGSAGGEPTVYVDEGVFETERYERDVSVEITDRTGQPVAAIVRQDADGDGTWELEEAFCGATAEPVGIAGGTPVVVKVQPGPCADGTPAVMTSGSIGVTFTGFTKPAAAPALPGPSCTPAREAREITETYVAPSGLAAADESLVVGYFETSESEAIGAAVFRAGCGEDRLELAVTDQSGLPTRALVYDDPDGPSGDAPQTFVADVCGATDGPVDVTPGAEVAVFVVEGPCADATPAAATTGTVTATLTAP